MERPSCGRMSTHDLIGEGEEMKRPGLLLSAAALLSGVVLLGAAGCGGGGSSGGASGGSTPASTPHQNGGTIKMALISLRMLLESPNPKDPQDAEVAKMLLEDPDEFAVKAHEWAVKYAGAPRREQPKQAREKAPPPVAKNDPSR